MSGTSRCCSALILVLILCCLGVGPSSAQALEPAAKLIVGVYNYAKAGYELEHAEQEATEIFSQAGIQLQWVDCPLSRQEIEKLRLCEQARVSNGAFLRILPESMAAKSGRGPTRFGFTAPPNLAFVFADRAQKFAKDKGILLHVILGLVMSHELGHLLLGTEPHSATGIMREDLQLEEFRRAEHGIRPAFSAAQVQRMRARLEGQTLVQKCPTPPSQMEGPPDSLRR